MEELQNANHIKHIEKMINNDRTFGVIFGITIFIISIVSLTLVMISHSHHNLFTPLVFSIHNSHMKQIEKRYTITADITANASGAAGQAAIVNTTELGSIIDNLKPGTSILKIDMKTSIALTGTGHPDFTFAPKDTANGTNLTTPFATLSNKDANIFTRIQTLRPGEQTSTETDSSLFLSNFDHIANFTIPAGSEITVRVLLYNAFESF